MDVIKNDINEIEKDIENIQCNPIIKFFKDCLKCFKDLISCCFKP